MKIIVSIPNDKRGQIMNLPITCVASPSVIINCSHLRQNKRTVLLIFRATVQLRDTSTRDTLSSLSPKCETKYFTNYCPFSITRDNNYSFIKDT
jgi:hypothetical protein